MAAAPSNSNLPRHVAIIMDGNGRWAQKRHLPRQAGHVAGVNAVREVVRQACEIGLENLTLFAFSSENWKRPPKEVGALMGLFRLYFRNDMDELVARGVRVRIIGSRCRKFLTPSSAEPWSPGNRRARRSSGPMRLFRILAIPRRCT